MKSEQKAMNGFFRYHLNSRALQKHITIELCEFALLRHSIFGFVNKSRNCIARYCDFSSLTFLLALVLAYAHITILNSIHLPKDWIILKVTHY